MNEDKLKFIISMFIFGTIGLARRFIPYSSTFVAFMRALIGMIFLLILNYVRKGDFNRDGICRNMGKLCFSGISLGVSWVLLFEAFQYTTVSIATVSHYMAPVFVIIFSPIVLKEKITLKKAIAVILAVIGMIFVSGVLKTGLVGLRGVYYGLITAVLYAANIFVNKKIEGINPYERTIVQLGFATITIFPYLMFTEGFSNFTPMAFPIFMLLVVGIVHTGITYALYFGSMANLSAQTVAILSYIDPIVAVLLSTFVLREELSPLSALGVVMVIGSAIFSELDLKKIRNRQ